MQWDICSNVVFKNDAMLSSRLIIKLMWIFVIHILTRKQSLEDGR